MTIIVKNPLLSLILPCRSRDQIPNLQQSGMSVRFRLYLILEGRITFS